MKHREFRAFLDAISDCFVRDDFDAWCACVRLPFSMVTPRGPVVMTNSDQLQRNFANYIRACRIMKVDKIEREPITLTPGFNDTIIGTYTTQLLAGGKPTTEAYVSSALLHPDADGWQMSSILNARGHDEWTGIPPSPLADKE